MPANATCGCGRQMQPTTFWNFNPDPSQGRASRYIACPECGTSADQSVNWLQTTLGGDLPPDFWAVEMDTDGTGGHVARIGTRSPQPDLERLPTFRAHMTQTAMPRASQGGPFPEGTNADDWAPVSDVYSFNVPLPSDPWLQRRECGPLPGDAAGSAAPVRPSPRRSWRQRLFGGL